jgi:hypothetical protein
MKLASMPRRPIIAVLVIAVTLIGFPGPSSDAPGAQAQRAAISRALRLG